MVIKCRYEECVGSLGLLGFVILGYFGCDVLVIFRVEVVWIVKDDFV